MYWTKRFEYHLNEYLGREHGISTLHNAGQRVLSLARVTGPMFQKMGVSPGEAAVSAVEAAMHELGVEGLLDGAP